MTINELGRRHHVNLCSKILIQRLLCRLHTDVSSSQEPSGRFCFKQSKPSNQHHK